MRRNVVWFSLLTAPTGSTTKPSRRSASDTPAPPETRCGAAVSESDITSQLHALIDVVVHAARDGSTFMVDKVWFRRCAT